MCVLDTGSEDLTPQLAREAGARVESFAWCDDFAAARNASLAMASGDWVLVLDADEALEQPGVRTALESFAAAHPDRAGQVTIVDRQEKGELRSRVTRFFPRRPDLGYVGRFHEQPHFGDRPCPAVPLAVEVAHYGYCRETIEAKDKVARNRAFLERLVAEQPDEPYHHYQLGRTHLVGGDVRAALASFGAALEHVPLNAPYLALLAELTCHCLRQLGRSAEALELISGLAEAWPQRSDTRYLEGLLAIDTGDLALAEQRFRQCLTMSDVQGLGGSSSEMSRTWGPAYHLALMREHAGRSEEARAWYERALGFRPQHAESLAALARLDARTRA